MQRPTVAARANLFVDLRRLAQRTFLGQGDDTLKRGAKALQAIQVDFGQFERRDAPRSYEFARSVTGK